MDSSNISTEALEGLRDVFDKYWAVPRDEDGTMDLDDDTTNNALDTAADAWIEWQEKNPEAANLVAPFADFIALLEEELAEEELAEEFLAHSSHD